MLPCKSTAEEVSFEWSHHRISSTDSKVRNALHVSIIDSGIERVKTELHENNNNGDDNGEAGPTFTWNFHIQNFQLC